MPWSTPPLRQVRERIRDDITSSLSGAAVVGNTVLRIMADATAGMTHLVLKYIDWLALQLLPDTAETEWLDRHGDIWLVNSDGTTGRKGATYAEGIVSFTGIAGTIIPVGSELTGAEIGYETTEEITLGSGPTNGPVRALDSGVAGNLEQGTDLTFEAPPIGADGGATVVELSGGTDEETDEALRVRILQRIQNPPMGGSEADYVRWALAVPGVTRAWAKPEQGPGTITVRFLMDVVRADDDGWPTPDDVQDVADYIDKMRPVTVMDTYVVAPIKEFIDVTITDLVTSDAATDWTEAIAESLRAMLYEHAAPGQTIYEAWISYAIMNTPGIQSFNLVDSSDHVMPSLGHMAVIGTVLFIE